MVSILDIAPAAAKGITVPVRGQEVDVHGLSLSDIAYLVQNFPEVRMMFSGKDVTFDIDTLAVRAPQLVYQIIQCGTSRTPVGNDEQIEAIASLTIEEQMALLDGILNETFKGGIGPFVQTLRHLVGAGRGVVSGMKAQDSNGQKQPSP